MPAQGHPGGPEPGPAQRPNVNDFGGFGAFASSTGVPSDGSLVPKSPPTVASPVWPRARGFSPGPTCGLHSPGRAKGVYGRERPPRFWTCSSSTHGSGAGRNALPQVAPHVRRGGTPTPVASLIGVAVNTGWRERLRSSRFRGAARVQPGHRVARSDVAADRERIRPKSSIPPCLPARSPSDLIVVAPDGAGARTRTNSGAVWERCCQFTVGADGGTLTPRTRQPPSPLEAPPRWESRLAATARASYARQLRRQLDLAVRRQCGRTRSVPARPRGRRDVRQPNLRSPSALRRACLRARNSARTGRYRQFGFQETEGQWRRVRGARPPGSRPSAPNAISVPRPAAEQSDDRANLYLGRVRVELPACNEF
jgi:hypothetical protein